MTGLVSRSLSLATDAERGADDRPASEGREDVPEELRHRPERVTDHDGPPYAHCPHCQWSAPVGSINPYDRCPGRERASPIDARADRAKADAGQASLFGARLATDGGSGE